MDKGGNIYIGTDSGVVKSMRDRTLGELIDLATKAIRTVDACHGEKVAAMLEQIGSEVTDATTDAIEMCSHESGLGGVARVYLHAILAANVSISLLAAADGAKFSLELEDYQRAGGAE